MLYLETTGSWRDMGEALGRRFQSELADCIARFCPALDRPSAEGAAALRRIKSQLERHAPGVLDETAGMAAAMGLDADAMLGYRLFPDLPAFTFAGRAAEPGCSVFYTHDPRSTLLARNCDLENDISQDIQVCQVSRPTDGAAFVTTGYLGLLPINGMNEHGVGLAGASAHTLDGVPDAEGLPAGAKARLIFAAARSTREAIGVLSRQPHLGKSFNLLVGDAEGRAELYELVPGHVPRSADHTDDQDHTLACTNVFGSGRWRVPDEPEYVASAQVRRDRIEQRLGEPDRGSDPAGAQALLREVAMPGDVIAAEGCPYQTAYSQVMDLGRRTMWLAEGHPAEAEYREVSL
jgi:hypothetical protein